jgi:hypothetical protein
MVEQVRDILDGGVSCLYSEADHCWDVEGPKRATESNRGHGRYIFAWARDETNNRNNEYKKRFRGAANHGLASGAPMTASLVAGTNKRQPPRTDLRFISQSFFRNHLRHPYDRKSSRTTSRRPSTLIPTTKDARLLRTDQHA